MPTRTSAGHEVVRNASATGEAEVAILSTRGDRVRRFASSAPQEHIDLSELPAGVYTLQYRTRSAQWMARLVLTIR